jgi:putative addiction module component (TIGR02574 family)
MQLSPAERIELAQELWDRISPSDMPPLTPAQCEELDRRLAEHEQDPTSAIAYEDVRAWLRISS